MDEFKCNFSTIRLSLYKSVTQLKPIPITVLDLSKMILDQENQHGSIKGQCDWYLTLLENDKDRAKQFKSYKLPAYCPTGLYLRSKDDRRMVESSRLVWIDFDDTDNAEEVRNNISKISNCVLCYISLSGKGVHGLFATSVIVNDSNTYGKVWDLIVRGLIPDQYKQYIDPASRKLGQLAIPSVDKQAHIQLLAPIRQLQVPPDKKHDLAQAHQKIGLPKTAKLNKGDYAQRQLRLYNLIDRTRPPEDYPTWIRLLASLKNGEIPEGVAQSWSARGSNFHQKSFDRAWKSLDSNGGVTIGTFIWWSQSQR